MRDNVFTATATESIFRADRDFQAIDVTGNFFTNPLMPAYFDAWNGSSTTGCSDTLGAYGGPITATPALNSRPTVGPR